MTRVAIPVENWYMVFFGQVLVQEKARTIRDFPLSQLAEEKLVLVAINFLVELEALGLN